MIRLLPSLCARYIVLCGLAVFSLTLHANELDRFLDQYLPASIQWHGFASQGFSYSENNNFLGSSEDGSFEYNEFGLGASWSPASQVQLSAQGLYRQAGNATSDRINLDYGVLDVRAIDSFDHGAGFRIGRLKNPYGFFNETRDVAATRPSVLLSQSTYVDYLRELIHSSDSVGFYAHKELSYGTLSFNSTYGKPVLTERSIDSIVAYPSDGKFEDEVISSTQLSYETGSGIWRIALSHANFEVNFEPASTDRLPNGAPLQPGTVSVRQWLLSNELNLGAWQLISEYQIRNVISRDIFYDTFKNNGLSYYFQLGFHLTDSLNMYLRRDVIYLDKNDKHGRAYEAGAPDRFARDAFAKDMVLGLLYKPNGNWSFGAEAHTINGTYWLPNVENPDRSAQAQRWHLFLLNVAYRF